MAPWSAGATTLSAPWVTGLTRRTRLLQCRSSTSTESIEDTAGPPKPSFTEMNVSLSVGEPSRAAPPQLYDSELIEYPPRRFPSFEHRRHYEVRTAHHVAAGEYFRVRGLKSIRLPGRDTHAAVVVQTDRVRGEPLGRARQKSESDDHRIRRHDLLRSGHRNRHAPAPRIGRAEPRLDELDALDALASHDLDRLAVEEELDALLAAVLVVASRARHVALIAPVSAGDRLRPLAHRGAVAIHRRIATPQHDDALARHADEGVCRTLELELVADVGDEKGQRLVHPGKLLARQAALDRCIGPHAEKHGVVFREQLFERNIRPHFAPQAKLHPHALHDLAALLHDLFLELEGRDSEGQQTADARVAIEHHGLHAVAHQDVGAGEPRGTGSHDRHALVRRAHMRHVGLPAAL